MVTAAMNGPLVNGTNGHHEMDWCQAALDALPADPCAGTDCGATDTPFDALVDELHTYVRAGIPEPEVVAMATCGNARLLGLTETGAIAPGLRADMVLLAGDPFKDLDVLRAPLKVLKSGSVVCDRESANP